MLLPAFLFATGFRLDALVPLPIPLSSALKVAAWVLIVAGVALMAAGTEELWFRGKGLPVSHLPPAEFVASGVYRRFRHPIYVGFAASFAGASLLLGSFWSLAFSTPLLILGWIGYALYYEEPLLISRFGDMYLTYRTTTPLLVPLRAQRLMRKLLHPLFERLCRKLSSLADHTVLFRRGAMRAGMRL